MYIYINCYDFSGQSFCFVNENVNLKIPTLSTILLKILLIKGVLDTDRF